MCERTPLSSKQKIDLKVALSLFVSVLQSERVHTCTHTHIPQVTAARGTHILHTHHITVFGDNQLQLQQSSRLPEPAIPVMWVCGVPVHHPPTHSPPTTAAHHAPLATLVCLTPVHTRTHTHTHTCTHTSYTYMTRPVWRTQVGDACTDTRAHTHRYTHIHKLIDTRTHAHTQGSCTANDRHGHTTHTCTHTPGASEAGLS